MATLLPPPFAVTFCPAFNPIAVLDDALTFCPESIPIAVLVFPVTVFPALSPNAEFPSPLLS